MGNNLSLIHLPAQSGKTRKMTDLIQKWRGIMAQEKIENNINIVFTSNTKLLAKQTHKRVSEAIDPLDDISDISDDFSTLDSDSLSESLISDFDVDVVVPRTYPWIHTKNSKKPDELAYSICVDDEYDNIICCTNKARTKRVFELLTSLNKAYLRKKLSKRVSIWIDEADASINIWNKYIDTCSSFGSFIYGVVMITATMVPVYKYLNTVGIECRLRVYENTHQPTYHKYAESIINHDYSEDLEGKSFPSCVSYVCAILDSVEVPRNSKWFCPGIHTQASHEAVCVQLLRRGFNVLILNGVNKEIRYFDKRPALQITDRLEDDFEISVTLNKLYYTTDLHQHPFAVTGNLCIGRGITFASKTALGEFLFTHGIIPTEITSAEDAYQLVSRCLGNIKNYSTYSSPTLFVNTRIHSEILEQETLAIDLASILYNINDDETQLITPEIIKNMVGRDIISSKPKHNHITPEPVINKFTIQDKVKKYYHDNLKKRLNGTGPHNIKLNPDDGYYYSTIRSNKKVYTCNEVYRERKWGLTDKNYRYYACYENISDKSTLQFWLIHMPHIVEIETVKLSDADRMLTLPEPTPVVEIETVKFQEPAPVEETEEEREIRLEEEALAERMAVMAIRKAELKAKKDRDASITRRSYS